MHPGCFEREFIAFADLSLPVAGVLPGELAYDPANTALTDQLVLEVAATQPRDPTLILRVTSGVTSAAVTRAFRYLADYRSGDLALVGLAGLIQRGDVPTLLRVEQTAASVDWNGQGGGEIAGAIGWIFRSPDPAGVASLGRMATSSSSPTQLQTAAANALKALTQHSCHQVQSNGFVV